MAEDKSQERKEAQDSQEEDNEEILVAAPVRDAAQYKLQPTRHELPGFLGNPPEDRFQEEVLKDSDEDTGDGYEAHPEENRAPLGIGPDDELPDTTGRGVHRFKNRDK